MYGTDATSTRCGAGRGNSGRFPTGFPKRRAVQFVLDVRHWFRQKMMRRLVEMPYLHA